MLKEQTGLEFLKELSTRTYSTPTDEKILTRIVNKLGCFPNFKISYGMFYEKAFCEPVSVHSLARIILSALKD